MVLNCVIKLTKKCLKTSFLERLIKKYKWNTFGHTLSLAEITRNKFASFSYLDMGTKSLFMFFHFSKFGLQNVKNYSSKSLRIYS